MMSRLESNDGYRTFVGKYGVGVLVRLVVDAGGFGLSSLFFL